MSNPYVLDKALSARHEAGHATAYWLIGKPAPRLQVDRDGGVCEPRPGTRLTPSEALLVNLSGFAVESYYGLVGTPDIVKCYGVHEDIDMARDVIIGDPFYQFEVRDGERVPCDMETAIVHHYRSACRQLLPHDALVQWIAQRLVLEGELNRRSVGATFGAYGRALRGQ